MIYVYVMDALRADHVNEELTPNLMALARDGVQFTNAFSQATWSLPSAISILTGLYPTAVGQFGDVPPHIRLRKIGLPPNIDTLGSLFSRHGFATSGYSTNEFFAAAYNLDHGFDVMPVLYDLPQYAQRAEISRKVARKLDRNRDLLLPLITSKDLLDVMWSDKASLDKGEKQLTVIWSMDTHAPFYDRNLVSDLADNEIEIISRLQDDIERSKELYEGMVRFADEQFGTFIKKLKSRQEYEDSFIIVCSDHGESFGELGSYAHSNVGFFQELHVPFIMKFPGGEFEGTSVDQLVALLDILPTLAHWYHIELPYHVHGENLVPIIKNEVDEERFLFVYDQLGDQFWRHGMVRNDDHMYVFKDRISLSWRRRFRRWRRPSRLRRNLRHLKQDILARNREWFFDVRSGHPELLSVKSPAWKKLMVQKLDEFLKDCEEFFTENVQHIRVVNTDKKVEQRLHDLGYLE